MSPPAPTRTASLYPPATDPIHYAIDPHNTWHDMLVDFDSTPHNLHTTNHTSAPPTMHPFDPLPPLSHSTTSSPSDLTSIPDFDAYPPFSALTHTAMHPHDLSPFDDRSTPSFSPFAHPHHLAFPEDIPDLLAHPSPAPLSDLDGPFAPKHPQPHQQTQTQQPLLSAPHAQPAPHQRRKSTTSVTSDGGDKLAKHDPLAGAFVRAQLGAHKWGIFSSRLAEQRSSKHKLKLASSASGRASGGPPTAGEDDAQAQAQADGGAVSMSSGGAGAGSGCSARPSSSSAGGASVLDFLVKVEVVKQVLRTYVP